MKTRSLVCSLVLLGSGGCVVPHSLGMSEAESADEGGEGGSSSDNTGGVSMSDTGGGVSDGDGGESGGMMTASSGFTTAPTTADVDDGDGDAGSSGGFDQCEPLGEQFLWLWDSMDFESTETSLGGEMLVSGSCDVLFVDSDPLDPSIKGFGLTCTVHGRMDGADINELPFNGFFAAGGSLVQEALEARLTAIEVAGDPVELKFAQSNWGMGLDRWFVVADQQGEILFEGFAAEEPNPTDDIWLENDFEVLPEILPWGDLIFDVYPSECDTFDDVECNGTQLDLGGAGADSDQWVISVGHSHSTEGRLVFLDQALDYSQATCTDHPLALVRYASYAP